MPPGTIETSIFKLHDNVDQLEYLISKGRIDSSFGRLVDVSRSVLTDIKDKNGSEAKVALTSDQLERLGSSYNRVIYYEGGPSIGTSAVNDALDFQKIEDSYLSSPLSVTTLDDFLTPEALRKLRVFCLESTVYFSHSRNDFVDSQLATGFNCDLLYQVIAELKDRFPRVLGDHHLSNMWVYRYNNQSSGVYPHTDEGAVTFNFWITPTDANLLPDRGGLIIYTKEQPYDWDWRYFNKEKY